MSDQAVATASLPHPLRAGPRPRITGDIDHHVWLPCNRRVPLLSSGPFHAWVNVLIERAEMEYEWGGGFGNDKHDQELLTPLQRVAGWLGISTDSLRHLRTRRWIEETTVDACTTHEGSIHIAELYPQYWAMADAGGPKRYLKQRRQSQCQ